MTSEMQQKKRPTSFDVAKAAGVSRATVSHVLNGRGKFPEETRNRVLAAASQLQYTPSPAGRALVRGRSDILVVVIPYTTFGSNLQDLVDDITAEAGRHGLSVVVRFAGADPDETLAAVQHFRPVAVVDIGALGPAQRNAVETAGAIVIPRLRNEDDPRNNPNFVIGQLMLAELLSRGPRRVVFAALLDDRSDPFGPARYEGMKHSALERGLPEPERIEVPLVLKGAKAALMGQWTKDEPLAIACYNDAVALAVLAAGRELGLSVPEQLSVMGVDATAEGQLVSPRLTTLRVGNAPVMDRIAADLAALNGGNPVAVEVKTKSPFAVISGETT
ncbi:LacI family DNA-binding transcriptional regulator [Paenarthrobacter nicotinovorans]|uniref:LacI family DNA-binding transcriptional regulator n=1 Tax=Paenarthrobacter nicotinovorans TaxID=29320 RepID=UPI003747DD9F